MSVMSINKEKVISFLIILLNYYQLVYAVACSIFVLQSHRKLQPQDPLFFSSLYLCSL